LSAIFGKARSARVREPNKFPPRDLIDAEILQL
jgi:hypothetical protein